METVGINEFATVFRNHRLFDQLIVKYCETVSTGEERGYTSARRLQRDAGRVRRKPRWHPSPFRSIIGLRPPRASSLFRE